MQTIRKLSLAQLRKMIKIRERIDTLETQLEKLLGESASAGDGAAPTSGKVDGRKRKRTMSAAHRAKLAKAAKARWKKAKAAGKRTL